jgi:hypothetical protein
MMPHLFEWLELAAVIGCGLLASTIAAALGVFLAACGLGIIQF